MFQLKPRLAWAAALVVVAMPIMSACGTESPTATVVPANTAEPTAMVAETPTTAMAGETPTTAMAGETPTTAMAGETPTTGTGAAMSGTDALAAEGVKADPAAKGKFEFFSWWTSGGEADGKNDILNLYKQLYPSVEVVDAAVAGGGGDQAKGVLKTRMQASDPPDTFQVHGGPELIDGYVKVGKMEPITSIYKDMGMMDAYPKQLLDLVSNGGEIYSIPANIHRGNVLFYNKKIFADNSITPPTTWAEFFAAADKLKAKGIAPLAVGAKNTWAVTMLFEDLLLAQGGPDKFKALMTGTTPWTDTAVVGALTDLQKMFTSGYVNTDFSAVEWDAAAGQLVNGKAAMTIMGDWAKGYFQANDPKWADNYGWIPSPGTKGIFKVITDSFGLPKGAKNPENTKNFLRVLGSKTGQVTFNLRKGSIPARTDVDTSKFDVYMKDAAADFKSATALVGSAPHGSATDEAFASALNEGINTFIGNPKDPIGAAAGLLAKAQELLQK